MRGEELTRYTDAHWGAWREAIKLGEPAALWALARLRVAILMQSTQLTVVERDTLYLYSQGHTLPEVAELMFFTKESIRKRTAKIRLKLDAKTTLQAVSIAQREGMLTDGTE